VHLKQVDRSWLVELKETEPADVEEPAIAPAPQPEKPVVHAAPAHHPRATSRRPEPATFLPPEAPGAETATMQDTGPAGEEQIPGQTPGANGSDGVARSSEAMRILRSIFASARTAHHWPMYLRSFKQVLRSAESAFDERNYGFTSVYDLVRQAQREGLLRIERNRKGILRIFPGEQFPPAGQVQKPAGELFEHPGSISGPETMAAEAEQDIPVLSVEIPEAAPPLTAAEPIQEAMPEPMPGPESPAPRKSARPSRGRKPAAAKQPKTRKAPPRKRSRKTGE
jgi:hypothetical protein